MSVKKSKTKVYNVYCLATGNSEVFSFKPTKKNLKELIKLFGYQFEEGDTFDDIFDIEKKDFYEEVE